MGTARHSGHYSTACAVASGHYLFTVLVCLFVFARADRLVRPVGEVAEGDAVDSGLVCLELEEHDLLITE